MKQISVLRNVRINYIVLGAVLAASIFGVAKTVYAEQNCYGQYGQQIPCPVENKAFTISKYVQVNDHWKNNAPNIAPDANVRFMIQIKNTGEVASILDVKDTLPANLNYVSVTRDGNIVEVTVNGKDITWKTPNLASGETVQYIVNTKANNTGIAANAEVCGIENKAQIVRNGVVEGQDSAYICIKNGDVAGEVINLPETATQDWTIFGVGIVSVLAGLLALNLIKVYEEYSA